MTGWKFSSVVALAYRLSRSGDALMRRGSWRARGGAPRLMTDPVPMLWCALAGSAWPWRLPLACGHSTRAACIPWWSLIAAGRSAGLPDDVIDLRDPVTDPQGFLGRPCPDLPAGLEQAEGCRGEQRGCDGGGDGVVSGRRFCRRDRACRQERYGAVPEHQARCRSRLISVAASGACISAAVRRR